MDSNTIVMNGISKEREKSIYESSKAYLENMVDIDHLEPVTEAYRIFSAMPYYKLQKSIFLPYNTKEPTKNEVVILNTTSIEDSIKLINHTSIYSMNRYKRYYIDYRYSLRILNKTFREVNRKNRIPIYAKVTEETGMNCINEIHNANHFNFYYDMSKYNQMYLEREGFSNSMIIKVNTIMTITKNVINDPRLKDYHKTMLIDANSWISKKGIDNNMTKKQWDNILFIFYYLMRKDPDAFKALGDIDIVIVGQNKFFKINPAKYDEKKVLLYRRLVNKILPNTIIEDIENPIDTSELKKELGRAVDIFKDKYSFSGDADETVDVHEERINTNKEEEKEIAEVIDKNAKDGDEINADDVMREIQLVREKHATGRSTASIKRDTVLREKQKKLKLDGISIDEVDKLPREQIKVPIHDVSNKVSTSNRNITKIAYPNIEKTYIKKMYRNDITRVIKSLNDKKIGIYILDISVEDTSDELNLKETWTVKLEDENRVRHTLKFDMPIFLDDRYIYLGGNKKVIIHQQMMKPIVKTSHDTVQLVSSEYNRKIFVSRYNTKSSTDIEMMVKSIEKLKASTIRVKRGNSFNVNKDYDTFFEYDELSKRYRELTNGKVHILFNQEDAEALVKEMKAKKEKEFDICFGYEVNPKTKEKKLLWINTNDQLVEDKSFCEYIADRLGGELKENFNKMNPGKKATYSYCTIMKKKVPVILLLSYLEGLTATLKKAEINYSFSDSPRAKIYKNQYSIKFADGYLLYEGSPFKNQLLLNGLKELHTELYELSEFNEKDAYFDIIETNYGKKLLASAFEQFYEFFIGPITKEVLDDFNYPTDFCGLVLFANELLSDNKYIAEMNFNNARIRSSEIVVTFLYEAIADAYLRYKNTAYSNNPVKMSIPQDIVIKNVLQNQIVENYSKLNPMTEAEKLHACTPKGPAGMNLSDAYTLEKRSYDSSMLGVIGMSTSPRHVGATISDNSYK